MNGTYIHCVLREPCFSPGKVDQDAAILAETARRLRGLGFAVRLAGAEEPIESDGRLPALVLAMCQGKNALARLEEVAEQVPIVNSPQAIANCYREKMVEILAARAVPLPRTVVVETAEERRPPMDPPLWVKRPDVHAMERGDVVFAATLDEASRAFGLLYNRGIKRAVLQRHVEGEVVKFYAVAGGHFFHCERAGKPWKDGSTELRNLAEKAAEALGLAVYGGDAVIEHGGGIRLIDINDWPSFCSCRAEAAQAIATWVARTWSGAGRADFSGTGA